MDDELMMCLWSHVLFSIFHRSATIRHTFIAQYGSLKLILCSLTQIATTF